MGSEGGGSNRMVEAFIEFAERGKKIAPNHLTILTH